MLAGALYYIALVALVGATILSAGLAMTRVTISRMAQPYITAGYQRALASLEQTVSSDMQAGGVPYPAPTFTPIPAECANAACTYKTSETIALTTAAAPVNAAACDASQTNCAPNVQSNAYVAESRLTAQISVTVTDASGATVAMRTGAVILRTFDAPPYVGVAGSREGTFDDIASLHAAGDDGGAPPATPNPCASVSPGVVDDTAVRVAYHNASSGACANGSSWSDASYSSTTATNGWSP